MQRSYLVKSPVHFADFGFFVKIGDLLVHDTSNANRLTVYRNGEMVKAVKQTSLGLAAMQKSGFIEEVIQQAPKVAAKAPAKPVEAPKPVFKREEPKPTPKPLPAPPKKKEEPKPEPPKPAPKPVIEDEDDEEISTDS
jgi:outer membrane biosynthesis protein TonB